MKRTVALVCLLALLLGMLAACTPPTPTPEPGTDPGTDPGTEDNPPKGEEKVAYVQTYPYTDDAGTVHITYQDTYIFQNEVQDIVNVNVTSKVTGTDTADSAVLVVNKEDKRSVYADGCGTATAVFRGGRQIKVEVHPSPLNLLLVTGQSNASADHAFTQSENPKEYAEWHHTYADYYLRTDPTMAYFTWTGQSLTVSDTGSGKTAADCVPTTLDWDTVSTPNGYHDPKVLSVPAGSTTFSQAGWSAALANEWVRQTGERVWIVNAAHGGKGIDYFRPSDDGTMVDNEYYQAISVFNLALETVYAEIDAGHFTLNHFLYYWWHGGADDWGRSVEHYYSSFARVHAAMMRDVVYDHNGETRELEMCCLFASNSVEELQLCGPRLAQYVAAGETEGVFSNVHFISNITEQWALDDARVEAYFLSEYGSAEAFEQRFGYKMPTTIFEVHPTAHYLMQGFNELGLDAAESTLRIINHTQKDKNYQLSYQDDGGYTVTLLQGDGFTAHGSSILLDATGGTLVYPAVAPVYYSYAGVALRAETEGFYFDRYRLYAEKNAGDTLTFSVLVGGEVYQTYTVEIVYASAFTGHMPLYEQTGRDADGNLLCELLGMQSPWSVGYVEFATGRFTEYSVFSRGWLGAVAGQEHGPYASFYAGTWKASIQPSSVAVPAVCYTAEKAGTLAVMAEQLATGHGEGVMLAILVNGEMVWPTAGGSLNLNKQDWYFANGQETSTAVLSYLWKDLRIPVEEGDEIQFCLGRDNNSKITINGQPSLYPIVYYDEED